MASALASATPLQHQQQFFYELKGTINASLQVKLDQIPGATKILGAYPANNVSTALAAAASLQVSASVASDGKSVTFYQWDAAGAAGAADHPFSALVLCSAEPNTP